MILTQKTVNFGREDDRNNDRSVCWKNIATPNDFVGLAIFLTIPIKSNS